MEQKILKKLQKCKTIEQLKQTHLQILIQKLQHSNFVMPKLITLSSQLDSLQYTIKIFLNLQNPNTISYNTIIKCFLGKTYKDALLVYNQMKASMVAPNSYTFSFILKCFESFEAWKCGIAVHSEIVKMGFCSSVFVRNNLLNFYAKCGKSSGLAWRVFEEMTKRDVVSWNLMIGAYMEHGEIDCAMGLFDFMPERSIVTWNSVVSGLSKEGNMELARSVFEKMPEKNEVSWNSMISGYARIGDMEAAKCIFNQMQEKSIVSWTALISGYATIGDLESASSFFNLMPFKYVVTWNAMISGYVNNKKFDLGLSVFHQMLTEGNCKPDHSTLTSVLSACSHLGSLEHGKWIDSYIKKKKFQLSIPLGNALIDMFAKCGDLESAKAVFDKMDNRCIITWTAMISGLAVNGQCSEALNLFPRMKFDGIKPDHVIFIAVLSACTHGGLVEEGKWVYKQMVEEYNIKPRIEHYGCMIDLLGRAGKLEEAARFIESMHLKPNAVIWATLLSACKTHGSGEMLESVGKIFLDQEPSNPDYLMLVSNLSAAAGQWEEFSSFRVAMRQHGVEKVPGCSSIQIANRVHEFLAKDTRHVQRKEIYGALCSLNKHLHADGDIL
ncbi:pentatricopeptide repeat-containing protein At1g08070, chloroplastic-like [Pistacia vera]|uniref:pentatricopeptide repeat-containing protein At1g08070, chloroplastic-like n=1 Tax=Pistacia vera TaxID=55513 RepID=UPI001262FDF2|nr:pentatricopeptide repeat-containing protein At1g08070, chloroplastic-like [Pistacia vera]